MYVLAKTRNEAGTQAAGRKGKLVLDFELDVKRKGKKSLFLFN